MNDTILLDVQWLTLAGGALIPLLTGVLTKRLASSSVKALVTLGLTAVSSGVDAAVASNGNVVLREWVGSMVTTYAIAIISYYGLWKPTGTAAVVQNVVPDRGIGSSSALGEMKDTLHGLRHLPPEERRAARRPVPTFPETDIATDGIRGTHFTPPPSLPDGYEQPTAAVAVDESTVFGYPEPQRDELMALSKDALRNRAEAVGLALPTKATKSQIADAIIDTFRSATDR